MDRGRGYASLCLRVLLVMGGFDVYVKHDPRWITFEEYKRRNPNVVIGIDLATTTYSGPSNQEVADGQAQAKDPSTTTGSGE